MSGDSVSKGSFRRFGGVLALVVVLVAVPAVTLMLACGGCALLMGRAAQVADAQMGQARSAAEQARVDAKAREAVALAAKITGESAGSYGPLDESGDTGAVDEAARLAAEAEHRKEIERARNAVAQKAAALSGAAKELEKTERIRVWQTPGGTFKIEAEFVRYADGKVTLRKADGSELEMEVANLSDDDKAWIERNRAKPQE